MPKLVDIPFAVQSGAAGITQNSQERLINMFCEITSSGRGKLVRRQRACLAAVYSLAGEKRCIEENNGLHYLIVGSTLYKFDGTTLTTLGTLGTSTGHCSMVFNDNDEIMISDGVTLSWWNGSALAAVTNPAAFVPGVLSYLNGYAIVNSVGTDQFFISAANDFSAIDALDFATAESATDALITTFADHNEVWLIGKKTVEIWQDVGGTDFPFQAITTAKVERGSAAANSVAADDNTVILLGNDLVVYRFEGYRPTRISSYAVEEFLRTCSAANIANATALIYTIGGNKFYTLRVPGEGSWQYNFATGLWNEVQTYGYDDWRVIGSNGHYADYVLTDTGIASLSMDVNADEGGVVVRKAVSAPGWAGGNRITMTEMFIDCEVGRAATGITPELMVRIARNGETFGNIRLAEMGVIGEYDTRPFLRFLGQGRKPVFEISASGDFRFALMGIELNASVGNS